MVPQDETPFFYLRYSIQSVTNKMNTQLAITWSQCLTEIMYRIYDSTQHDQGHIVTDGTTEKDDTISAYSFV